MDQDQVDKEVRWKVTIRHDLCCDEPERHLTLPLGEASIFKHKGTWEAVQTVGPEIEVTQKEVLHDAWTNPIIIGLLFVIAVLMFGMVW